MTGAGASPRQSPPEAKRFPGKPFAIGFGTFLVVATVAFYYFAQRAEVARQHALERMEADGLVTAPSE